MDTRKTARELARDISERSPCGVMVGAVLSDNSGRIISWGWNHYKNTGAWPEITVHAEEHAIARANPKRLRSGGITLTVFGKRSRNNSLVCSKPCERVCLPLAMKHGIKKLEYIARDKKWEVLTLKYV